MTSPYEDIIHLPHHVSDRHVRMSLQDRAAQFSPFAALTGYDAILQETARLTDQRIELGPDARQELDLALNQLRVHMEQIPTVSVTHFVTDCRKTGGAYTVTEGTVEKIDTTHQWLMMNGNLKIWFEDILCLQILPRQI